MHITKPMARLLRMSSVIKIDDLCEKQANISTNKLSCLLVDVENEIKQCVHDIKFSSHVQEYRQWQPTQHVLPKKSGPVLCFFDTLGNTARSVEWFSLEEKTFLPMEDNGNVLNTPIYWMELPNNPVINQPQ